MIIFSPVGVILSVTPPPLAYNGSVLVPIRERW
jgi:hypothetical protein